MTSIRFQIQKTSTETSNNLTDESQTINYNNQDSYTGDMNNGRREGEGKYTFSNGDVYEGAFENNEISGKGKYLFDNGNEYEGTFQEGTAQGYGTFTWMLDSHLGEYTGFFLNNEASGKGKLVMRTGDIYEGEFSEGIFHGKGVMKFCNGDVFEGNYNNGRPSGNGKMLFGSAKIVMNRNFNQNGIDRANTNELKRSTFSLAKKKKTNVKVQKDTFRPKKAGRNPNKGIMNDILGSIGVGVPKSRIVKKTSKKRTKTHWTKKISTKKKIASVVSNVSKAKVVKVPRTGKSSVSRKNMKSFKDGSYLDYQRTNVCGTSRRKREGLDLEDIFTTDSPIKRTKSILQSFETAKKMLGYERLAQIREEENEDEEGEEEEGMIEETKVNDQTPQIQLTQILNSNTINPQSMTMQNNQVNNAIFRALSRVGSNLKINAAA